MNTKIPHNNNRSTHTAGSSLLKPFQIFALYLGGLWIIPNIVQEEKLLRSQGCLTEGNIPYDNKVIWPTDTKDLIRQNVVFCKHCQICTVVDAQLASDEIAWLHVCSGQSSGELETKTHDGRCLFSHSCDGASASLLQQAPPQVRMVKVGWGGLLGPGVGQSLPFPGWCGAEDHER